MLLHGLAGHAGEWADTAGWLVDRCRVVALDAPGHGGNERHPADVSPEARVADAVSALQRLDLGAVVLIGQSLGGQTALLVASERPDLVRALIVAEASPGAGDEAHVAKVREALGRWPVPFPTREAAVDFFGGSEAWASGLERRADGWWPRFDVAVLVRMLREALSRDYWEQWRQIARPTLVVRGGDGDLDAAEAEVMVERLPHARLAEIHGAGHDVHLDRPAEWRAAVTALLDSL